MDSSQIDKLKQMLESRRDALFGRIQDRNAIAIENAADLMDNVRLIEDRDLATRILERDSEELRRVVAALNRIRMGTYGYCSLCDDPITWNRLRVLPHARLCVNCQESLERDGASEISFHEAVTGTLSAQ